jgi:tRNA(His) 5'-end guanylyltransferase
MDDLGDRIKSYEAHETSRKLIPGIPVYARMDGRSFSKFTRDMERPFDARMTAAMVDTLKHVVDKSGATVGYTQSDELSLAWCNLNPEVEPWFGGKVHKLTSVLASMATSAFMVSILNHFDNCDELLSQMPHFDCRVFQVPNLDELANCMMWRSLDCTKNSISQAASHYYSHAELQGKSGAQKQEMLFEKDVNFNNYPASFKRGTFVRKETVTRTFDPQEWASIPLNHRPDLASLVLRSELVTFDLPPLTRVKNKVACLFNRAEPELKEDTGAH